MAVCISKRRIEKKNQDLNKHDSPMLFFSLLIDKSNIIKGPMCERVWVEREGKGQGGGEAGSHEVTIDHSVLLFPIADGGCMKGIEEILRLRDWRVTIAHPTGADPIH